MPELFDTLEIGTMAARNRLVRAATAESLATPDGRPTRKLTELYEELADGGVGTIITGYTFVSAEGRPSANALSLADDAFENAYRQLTDAVHERGARIVAQLVYGGSKSKLAADDPRLISSDETAGGIPGSPDSQVPTVRIAGPSSVPHPSTGLVPYEASADDLERIVSSFAAAAMRARQFGFDGVEIHAAHGYLLSQFLSPAFNKRSDSYGGALENRARLACSCVSNARAALGDDFPLFVKLNSSDTREGTEGLTADESMQVARLLVDAGASALEVSGDWHAYTHYDLDEGPFFRDYGTRLAEQVEAPVIVTGGWRDVRDITTALETTRIAAVGLARPLICEPHLPNRWHAGNKRPARCTSCNYCCLYPGIPCANR